MGNWGFGKKEQHAVQDKMEEQERHMKKKNNSSIDWKDTESNAGDDETHYRFIFLYYVVYPFDHV